MPLELRSIPTMVDDDDDGAARVPHDVALKRHPRRHIQQRVTGPASRTVSPVDRHRLASSSSTEAHAHAIARAVTSPHCSAVPGPPPRSGRLKARYGLAAGRQARRVRHGPILRVWRIALCLTDRDPFAVGERLDCWTLGGSAPPEAASGLPDGELLRRAAACCLLVRLSACLLSPGVQASLAMAQRASDASRLPRFSRVLLSFPVGRPSVSRPVSRTSVCLGRPPRCVALLTCFWPRTPYLPICLWKVWTALRPPEPEPLVPVRADRRG